MTRSNASGSIERTSPTTPIPALAITASMPPNASTVPSTAAASASGSVTSASKKTAPGHWPATRSSSAGSRPTSDTRAPRAASRRAVSAPMPRAAPVTSTARPLRSQSLIGRPYPSAANASSRVA